MIPPTHHPTLAFVGAGRAGSGLARAFAAQGWRIDTVYSQRFADAQALAFGVGAAPVKSFEDLSGDLVFLSVPDDAIAVAASDLAAQAGADAQWTGRGVVHTSGATPVGVLEPLAARGAWIGGLHPAFPFSPDLSVIPDLAGVTFAVEADAAALRGWLDTLVASVAGNTITLPPGVRPVYHAALVFASNYTITLIALAQRLIESFGAQPEAAKSALDGLVGGMAASVRRDGAVAALPGPLVRADAGTIAAHMRALREVDPETARLYAALARATYPILMARGVPLDEIARVLEQEERYAKDNS